MSAGNFTEVRDAVRALLLAASIRREWLTLDGMAARYRWREGRSIDFDSLRRALRNLGEDYFVTARLRTGTSQAEYKMAAAAFADRDEREELRELWRTQGVAL